MTIDEIFNAFRNGTDQDKAALREFLWKPENLRLLSSPAFVQAAVDNADLFTLPEDDDAWDTETSDCCPCCGQRMGEEKW